MNSWIDELAIHPITKQLLKYYLLDLPLPASVAVEFGIDSMTHYMAIKAVLFGEVKETYTPEQGKQALHRRIVELDDVVGNGPRLNALVRKYAPQYAEGIHFETAWDVLYGRTDKLGF
jgi:hypothetical protein